MSEHSQPAPARIEPEKASIPIRSVLGDAFSTGAFGACVGYVVSGFLQVKKAKSIAAAVGLELESGEFVWTCVALGATLGAVIGIISGWFSHKNRIATRAAYQHLAASLGARFAEHDDGDLGGKLNPFFSSSDSIHVSNVLRFESDRLRIAVAEVASTRRVHTRKGTSTRTTRQTVVFLDSGDVTFPGFTLQPEGLMVEALSWGTGVEDLDFPGQPEFSKAYHLTAVHAENTRRLFDAPLLAALARTKGLYMRSNQGSLAIFRPGKVVAPEKLQAFVNEAVAILGLFDKSAKTLAATAELLPATKSDVKGFVEEMPGMMGRQYLVTRADLQAFLSQPPPRILPAAITKQLDADESRLSFFFGLMFLAVGAAFALISVQAVLGGAGLMSNAAIFCVVGIFFAVTGAWVCYAFLRSRSRKKSLLRMGLASPARIVRIDAIHANFFSEREYRMVVQYQIQGRTVDAACKILGDALERAKTLKRGGKPAIILHGDADLQYVLYTDSLLHVSPEYEP